MGDDEAVIVLRGGGVSVAVEVAYPVPRILHWGADLGPLDASGREALRITGDAAQLNNAPDSPRRFTLWPTERDGWAGVPAQQGNAHGAATTPRPVLEETEVQHDPAGGGTVQLRLVDRVVGMRATARLSLDAHGVLAFDLGLERDTALSTSGVTAPYALDWLTALLPVPERATELLDFTGKWCRERAPQRMPFGFGTHSRQARRGKPGHDSPYLLVAGTPGFGFRRGELWGVHVAWSGDQRYIAERLPEAAGAHAAVIGGGELPASGEIVLGHGDRYDAPTVLFAWSDQGLDGISARFHDRLRARVRHPRSPRPLVLNTWEAVYFDHDLGRLADLVDRGARVGVERFVLDDGWFLGRRGDGAGLGDWLVDPAVWPEGLGPLARLVHDRGMQFGLWFEPEMINLDSELARLHPDWIVGPREGLGVSIRNQHVLDIGRPDAFDYLLERIDALVTEHGVDYIKWDHNRDLLEAVGERGGEDRPIVHAQVVALYRMLDELRRRHPRLEIETCSGGGGRVDLGILERTDRVWPSDCGDPIERTRIERWTSLLVPPELIGSHVGATVSHTTGRATDMSFRLLAALGGHAGIEVDLTESSDEELEQLSRWSAVYRDLRAVLHGGRVVRADLAEEGTALDGVVAHDGGRAVFRWIRTESGPSGQSGRVAFPGLDPQRHYRLRVREDLGAARRASVADPEWMVSARDAWLSLPGAVLTVAGIPMPALAPQQAMLIEIERESPRA